MIPLCSSLMPCCTAASPGCPWISSCDRGWVRVAEASEVSLMLLTGYRSQGVRQGKAVNQPGMSNNQRCLP